MENEKIIKLLRSDVEVLENYLKSRHYDTKETEFEIHLINHIIPAIVLLKGEDDIETSVCMMCPWNSSETCKACLVNEDK